MRVFLNSCILVQEFLIFEFRRKKNKKMVLVMREDFILFLSKIKIQNKKKNG